MNFIEILEKNVFRSIPVLKKKRCKKKKKKTKKHKQKGSKPLYQHQRHKESRNSIKGCIESVRDWDAHSKKVFRKRNLRLVSESPFPSNVRQLRSLQIHHTRHAGTALHSSTCVSHQLS